MLGAARAYQANLAAIALIRDLVAKSLELGRVASWRSTHLGSSSVDCDNAVGRGHDAESAPPRRVGKSSATRSCSLSSGVETDGADANAAVNSMLEQAGDVHDAMIALQRAEMSLAARGADAQQARAGLSGHHADAGLVRGSLKRCNSDQLARAFTLARQCSRPAQLASLARRLRSCSSSASSAARRTGSTRRRTRCCSPTWTRSRPAQVVTRLKSMKVPYQLDDGGRAIGCPSSRVDELRLEFAAQGLPLERPHRLRDLRPHGVRRHRVPRERQLPPRARRRDRAHDRARISEVASARVHIAHGQGFAVRRAAPAKASVVLKLRDQRRWPPSHGQRHLEPRGRQRRRAAAGSGRDHRQLRPSAGPAPKDDGEPTRRGADRTAAAARARDGDARGRAARAGRRRRAACASTWRSKLNPQIARGDRGALGSEHGGPQPADIGRSAAHGGARAAALPARAATCRRRRPRPGLPRRHHPHRGAAAAGSRARHAHGRDHQLRGQPHDHAHTHRAAGRHRPALGGRHRRRRRTVVKTTSKDGRRVSRMPRKPEELQKIQALVAAAVGLDRARRPGDGREHRVRRAADRRGAARRRRSGCAYAPQIQEGGRMRRRRSSSASSPCSSWCGR